MVPDSGRWSQNIFHQAQQFLDCIRLAQHLDGLWPRMQGQFPSGQASGDKDDWERHIGGVNLFDQPDH